MCITEGWNTQTESRDYLLKRHMLIGEVFCTSPSRLKCKTLLCTVMPVWVDGHADEIKDLSVSINTSLSKADTMGCQSVAFPGARCADDFGFPAIVYLRTLARAMLSYLRDNSPGCSIQDLYICDESELTDVEFQRIIYEDY